MSTADDRGRRRAARPRRDPLRAMTGRQRVAYAKPCQRARDTVDRAFYRLEKRRGLLLSSILTVNR